MAYFDYDNYASIYLGVSYFTLIYGDSTSEGIT